MNRFLYCFVVFLLIMVGLILGILWLENNKQANISNFEECAAAGNPVMESYPRQCAAQGQTFTEDISQ